MRPADPTRLAAAVDEVAEAHFLGRPLAPARRQELALWIAGRQGQPGSYAGLPAPTPEDSRSGARTFSGEALRSGGGTAHILGQEA